MPMTPKQAIEKLLSRKWTPEQIARASGIHRASVYRILNDQSPTYATAVSLLKIAKGRPKPPEKS